MRCQLAENLEHFGNKNGRFLRKTCHFRVIARPQCGRGNLKVKGMASRNEAREWETRQKPYHKKHGFTASFCFLFLYFKVLFRSAQS